MDWLGQYDTLVQQIAVFALAAASVQLALRSGVFSLVGAGTWMIGAYTAAITVTKGGGTVLAFVLAVVLGAVVSLALSLLTRRISGLTLAMATIAFDLIVVIVIRSWESVTGGPLGLYAIPVEVTTLGAIIIAAVVAILLALSERGRIGRALVALREDSHAAGSVGVPVELSRHLITTASGALGALSGALYALMFNAIAPEQGGFALVTQLLSMVVIGGIDSWRGAYLGAAVLLLLPEFSRVFDRWNGLIYGLLLVAAVVWAPAGLLGVLQKAVHLVRKAVSPRINAIARRGAA
jgi:branched-chain amino acid transport system permease protein